MVGMLLTAMLIAGLPCRLFRPRILLRIGICIIILLRLVRMSILLGRICWITTKLTSGKTCRHSSLPFSGKTRLSPTKTRQSSSTTSNPQEYSITNNPNDPTSSPLTPTPLSDHLHAPSPNNPKFPPDSSPHNNASPNNKFNSKLSSMMSTHPSISIFKPQYLIRMSTNLMLATHKP